MVSPFRRSPQISFPPSPFFLLKHPWSTPQKRTRLRITPTISSPSKFRFLPDYGERYVGRKRPTLFVARWAQNAEVHGESGTTPSMRGILTVLAMSNASISFGQAQFVADDTLLATGYEFSEDGRRLGIMACYNRRTAIWELKLNFASSGAQDSSSNSIVALSMTKLSDPTRASRSPRSIPGTSAALWLSHALGGPYASCFALHRASLAARERSSCPSSTRFERACWTASRACTWTAARTCSRVLASASG
jgi:hypothetical protein